MSGKEIVRHEADVHLLVEVASGSEMSRRAAWGAYFGKKEHCERLLKLNFEMQVRMAEFALAISESECLCLLEPDGDLIKRARTTIAALRLNPRGSAAIEHAKRKRAA